MTQNAEKISILGALAAAAVPGAGYLVHRQPRRALYAAVGVLGLYLSGLLIGGINVVDRREDGLWFIAQAMTGPIAFATDYFHQNHLKVNQQGTTRSATPDEWDAGRAGNGPRYARPSVGKVNDVGSLFTALAGMMNLIIVIDCLLPKHAPHPARRRQNA